MIERLSGSVTAGHNAAIDTPSDDAAASRRLRSS